MIATPMTGSGDACSVTNTACRFLECNARQAPGQLLERVVADQARYLVNELRLSGSLMDSVQPSPGFERRSMLPPRISALCRMPGIPLPPRDLIDSPGGFNPLPLSATVSRISRSTTLSSALTAVQPEWREAL